MALPDGHEAGVGIAEEDKLVGGEAELGGGGDGFDLAAGSHGTGGAGEGVRMAAGEEVGDFVVVAHGEEADLHGQLEGCGFLDQAAGGEGFVIGMRGKDQEAVAVAEPQGSHGGGGGGSGEHGGGEKQRPAEPGPAGRAAAGPGGGWRAVVCASRFHGGHCMS